MRSNNVIPHYSWTRQMLLGDFIYNVEACAMHARARGAESCTISSPDVLKYADIADILQVTFDQQMYRPLNLDKPCHEMFPGYKGVRQHLWGGMETINQLMAQGHKPKAVVPPEWKIWIAENLPKRYVVLHTRKRNDFPHLSKRDPDPRRLYQVVEQVVQTSGLPIVFIGECAYFTGDRPHIELRYDKQLGRDMSVIVGAVGFIGCNSGPQHVAWIADVPSIMVDYTNGERAGMGLGKLGLSAGHKFGWQYLDKRRHPVCTPETDNLGDIAREWAKEFLR